MADLCFSTHQIRFRHITMRFSLATHSGNSFVSPFPWYFPCYDNRKKPKPRASVMQTLFTRNPIAAILMPTTEDIRKFLQVGTLGKKWINTIKHQVKSLLHCMFLKKLFPSHFQSQQVSQQNSRRAEQHSGTTATCISNCSKLELKFHTRNSY